MEITIKIMAEVTTTIVLRDGETVEDVCNRDVDIYINGYQNSAVGKEDLGADEFSITQV